MIFILFCGSIFDTQTHICQWNLAINYFRNTLGQLLVNFCMRHGHGVDENILMQSGEEVVAWSDQIGSLYNIKLKNIAMNDPQASYIRWICHEWDTRNKRGHMHIKLKVKSSKPERLRASGVIIYIRTVAKKKRQPNASTLTELRSMNSINWLLEDNVKALHEKQSVQTSLRLCDSYLTENE